MRKTQLLPLQTSQKYVVRVNFLSWREMAELPKLLMPDEQVLAVVSGFYSAGPAILCATTKRLMLVDKKMLHLNYEDVRFESIKEVSFSRQLIMSSARFFYAGRTLQFRSWYPNELRYLSQCAQHKVFEMKEEEEQLALSVGAVSEPSYTKPQQVITAHKTNNAEMERYLSERIARWRRASRFIDNLQASAEKKRLERQY